MQTKTKLKRKNNWKTKTKTKTKKYIKTKITLTSARQHFIETAYRLDPLEFRAQCYHVVSL